MRRMKRLSAIAAAGFLGAAALTATNASAAPLAQWTVTNPSVADTFTAVNSAGVSAVLTNSSTGAQLVCNTYAANGVAADGVRPTGSGLATIQNATFGTTSAKCTGPLGSTWTAKSNAPMALNGVSYSAGVTKGTITGVDITLSGTSLLGSCTAKITGAANTGTYTNATGVLQILADTTPALTISNVTGNCAGLLNNGNTAKFTAKYQVTPIITVTSP
ncbi:hypothetical protein [Streptomyces sp. SP18CS02]|uniref:hypothetical protein n=1 Tax=Streptomyces sp. SP18CS02 TaxID=3002531 RepID=UPI002E767842|nr:hypothetical protein [Streptomyces sp. SP18CS02]MEE1754019.1 hypothetical protein [Streptomyces sp. SP18CS02]